jgi:hypothetical protein
VGDVAEEVSYTIHTSDVSSGPYNESELRKKLQEYVAKIGREATARDVAVFEMREGSTVGGRLDVYQFLSNT